MILLDFYQLFEQGRVSIFSVPCFLETDISEQNKYEKRIETSVDNTVNDLRYQMKFENCVKDQNKFVIKRKIFPF